MANKPAAKSLIPMFSQVLSKTAMKFTDKETVGSLANKLKGLCDNPSSTTSRPNRIDRGEPLENVSHKTNVLGEFFGGIGNFIGDVGDAVVDFGHEVLTVIDDSLEEMSKASAEIAAFFAMLSLASGTVAVNTVVVPAVSGPAAVIAFVSGGISLIFAGGTVITGTALTVTGVLGTKFNGEKLTAEEATERIGKALVAIASGILSGLGGFAGMQMGATVQQRLNPKPNTTQANQQATSQGASGGGKVQVPDKARDIVSKIEANKGSPPLGYKGGGVYNNQPKLGGQKLPNGVFYKEYDVNPFVKGQGRGLERIVIGDDGSVWYTNNHYTTFTKIK